MITLILLHPLHATPIQSWTFTNESVIRIGRATDNEVVLYSAVVSRKHIELRRNNDNWEIVSLGANGTYVSDRRISQMPAIDGVTIRLAQSGPQIQIRLGVVAVQPVETKKTTPQPPKPKAEPLPATNTAIETVFGEPFPNPAAPSRDLSKETVIGEPFQRYIKDQR